MINKCKSTKRLPGCYAEFITFAILLRKRINQGLFIHILKKEKKKQSTVLGAAIPSIVKELRRTLILTSRANTKRALKKGVNNITFEIARKVVCKRNEKGMENPYMLYNLFGLKFIMTQWKTFFVVRTQTGNIILSEILGQR